jgi:WS/DGAT/MGAT family acyltransferase
MANGSRKKHLSAGDTLFLFLERDWSPLSIASVMEFEGTLRLVDCLRFVASKLPLIPRYTERVVFPPLNTAYPSWEPDPTFDIRHHIHEISLQQGTEEELKSVASDILSVTLDRNHPLWDITLMHGLKGKRTGVLARVHHCLSDGIAGVGLMNVLMDSEPRTGVIKRSGRTARRPSSQPAQDAGAALLQKLVTSYLSALQTVLQVQKEVLTAAEVMAHAGRSAFEQMINLAPEIAMPADRLPFNRLCRGPQKFYWCSLPLAEMQTMRDAAGAKLNDVILAIMTAAFRRYAQQHKVKLEDRLLRVIIPVNIRGDEDVSDLGNRISFAPVNIPLDIEDPRELLDQVQLRTQHVKATHLAEYVGMAGMLITSLPLPLQAVALPYVPQLPISLCNTICTNVPGPQHPLYFMGHKMLTWYPYVPIGGEMGINCAILTYNGTAYFGFTTDTYAAPDAGLLERFVPEAFGEIRQALGLATPRRRSRPKKKAPSSARERQKSGAPTVAKNLDKAPVESHSESAVAD